MVLCHGDVAQHNPALVSLEQQAHLTLTLKPLASGYSKDVHGQLLVSWSDPSGCVPAPSPQLLHYKLSDTHVRVFSRGTT